MQTEFRQSHNDKIQSISIWWSLSTLGGKFLVHSNAADVKIKVNLVVTVRKFLVNSKATTDSQFQYDGHCRHCGGSSLYTAMPPMVIDKVNMMVTVKEVPC